MNWCELVLLASPNSSSPFQQCAYASLFKIHPLGQKIEWGQEDRIYPKHLIEPHNGNFLTLCLLLSSADSFCKQSGPRSGPKKCRVWSGSKLFDILMVFMKEFFRKTWFWKKSADNKNSWTRGPTGPRSITWEWLFIRWGEKHYPAHHPSMNLWWISTFNKIFQEKVK